MVRIAIITGASSGMGKELFQELPKFYRQLDEIWLVARRGEILVELKTDSPIVTRTFAGDLVEDHVYKLLLEQLQAIQPDIRMLINCAGFGVMGNVEDMDDEKLFGMINLNCKALTKVTKLCLPYMKKGSRIINLSSAAAFSPQPGFAVYAATKAYVQSFSKALSHELKKRDIYVTAVAPGPVNTAFLDHMGKSLSQKKKSLLAGPEEVVRQALLDSRNKKRISIYGTPMKIAYIASKFLPSDLIMKIMGVINR